MRCATAMMVLLAGCGQGGFDPDSYITGLRILTVKAEPPEVPSGGMTHLTAFVTQTAGKPFTVHWDLCHLNSPTTLPNDCFLNDAAPYLDPLGSGMSVDPTMPAMPFSVYATMPAVPFLDLNVDATGGIYYPIKLRAVRGDDKEKVVAYRGLRHHIASAELEKLLHSSLSPELRQLYDSVLPNHNPGIDKIYYLPAGGGAPVVLEEAKPIEVKRGDQVKLAATLVPGSAESYFNVSSIKICAAVTDCATGEVCAGGFCFAKKCASDGDCASGKCIEGGCIPLTMETVRIAWHTTAGLVSPDTTGEMRPAPAKPCPNAQSGLCPTTLDLKDHIPSGATTAELYIVAIDERGGIDYTHRTLTLR